MNDEHRQMRKSRRGDIASIVIAIGAVGGFLYMKDRASEKAGGLSF
jgi:hypothetical protein